MKKVILFILSITMVLSLCACGGDTQKEDSNSPSTSTTSTNDTETSKSSDVRESMTDSEVEDEVSKSAIDAVLKCVPDEKYNLDKTKYKIGSIVENDNYEYEVSGTVYLYDKYGSVADVATFTCSAIWLNKEGSGVSVGSVDIDY